MNFTRIIKYTPWFLIAMALYPASLYLSIRQPDENRVNLALRKAADRLLRESGDSVSRIPGVVRIEENTWSIRPETGFSYDKLPEIIESAFRQHDIGNAYSVMVRRCFDDFIDLGYQQSDLSDSLPVPCSGREAPEGCHYIEVTFQKRSAAAGWWAAGLLLAAALAAWTPPRKTSSVRSPVQHEVVWTELGNSRLDISGQMLLCGGEHLPMTFRETKLLKLFAENPNQLLEREFIISKVWADEGVLVGRSLDVFVSRLRKKLTGDPSLAIVSVHGVGYKLAISRP